MYIRDKKTSFALVADKAELDYFHQASVKDCASATVYSAYCKMPNDSPAWLQAAFWLRDKMSALANVENIKGFHNKKTDSPPKVGEKLDFFDVVEISEYELILMSSDRHLSVLVAINMQSSEGTGKNLTITASVKNKNFFGHLYMVPVRPAHSFIVNNMLKIVSFK